MTRLEDVNADCACHTWLAARRSRVMASVGLWLCFVRRSSRTGPRAYAKQAQRAYAKQAPRAYAAWNFAGMRVTMMPRKAINIDERLERITRRHEAVTAPGCFFMT